MSSSLTPHPDSRPLLPSEPRASAALRKPEIDVWKVLIGVAIRRALYLRGWSLKEFSREIRRDERQCARWMAGTERPQFDTLFAVDTLRRPLLVAFAEIAGEGVAVDTVIRIRQDRL